jgi:hypothetical protein
MRAVTPLTVPSLPATIYNNSVCCKQKKWIFVEMFVTQHAAKTMMSSSTLRRRFSAAVVLNCAHRAAAGTT